MNATIPHPWQVNFGSGNDLVLSGNKPLAKPILDKFYVLIWHNFFPNLEGDNIALS